MTHRVEVLMDDAPYEALEAMARRCRRSVAEMVEELVMQHLPLGGTPPPRSLADIAGIVDDAGAATVDPDTLLYGGGARPRVTGIT
jgi:hypothetical protein